MGKQIRILLVEDSEDDIVMTQRALKKGKIINDLDVAHNGEEALRHLKDKDNHVPDLVLLDLNMSRMNGFELLQEMKKDPDLVKIPVVVLTSSARDSDIEKAYSLGANSYVTKPVEPAEFIKAIMELEQYWFELCKTP